MRPPKRTNMTILILSDSHGQAGNVLRAAEREKPQLCFFLGDGERDLEALAGRFPSLPVLSVRGNCDLRSAAPLSLSCAVGGVRVFAAHGHKYDVKHDPKLWEISAAAEEEGASLVLFGHTHVQRVAERDGKTLINPGSIGEGRPPAYAVLEIENGTYTIRLRQL